MTPKGWSTRRIADLAAINPEQLSAGTSPDYLVEYLDISSIERTGVITETKALRFGDAPSRARRRARAGDLLVSTVRPYLRSFARLQEAPPNLVASTGFAVVRPKSEFESAFIYQHILADEFIEFLKPRMRGGNYPAVTAEDVASYSIALPPLGEQRKIAAILSSVDDAIEATQAVIDQLQVVKKAVMAELLTRGLPGRHTRFNQTELGEVPEEWEVVRVGEVCERMFVGIAQAATHAYVTEGGVPIIRSTNVRANRLRTEEILRINDLFAAEMHSKALRSGDVLSARTGYPELLSSCPRSSMERNASRCSSRDQGHACGANI
jgi:type I restriction enzyme S subunit